MGKDLMNANFGPRYVKYSHKKAEHGFNDGDIYIGEWSIDTNLPHGRGIRILKCGTVCIGYFNNGARPSAGKYIHAYNVGEFYVGENTVDADGNRHGKYMLYDAEGSRK